MDKEKASREIGERIKKRRIELGLSQEELAKRMGNSSRASVSTVETGKEDLTTTRIQKFAKALGVDPSYIMGWEEEKVPPRKIPVLGRVAAGIPINMVEEVIDEEEIPGDMIGEYFGLKIKGDSMEPRIAEGDVVIVRQQPDVESGDIAIVTINGDDATCKRVMKYAEGIMLMSNNPKYDPKQFTKAEMERLNIRIIGKVVELRAKF